MRRETAPVRPTHDAAAALEWVGVHVFAVAAALFFVLPFVFVCLRP